MQTVQEIYQRNVRPLTKNQRLKLIELIVQDINFSLETATSSENKSLVGSIEIIDDDFDAVKRENARLFNETLEKRAREITE